MKLATVETDGTTRAAIIDGEVARLTDHADLRALLALHGPKPDARDLTITGEAALADVRLTRPVLAPAKTICVGLNYYEHAAEANLAIPGHPLLFAKYDSALIGPYDDILLPPESSKADWEAELAIVIGQEARRLPKAKALDVVAGYTVFNDITMRDYQHHTSQFLPGKTFDGSTPYGPWIVTGDEIDEARDVEVSCSVNGVLMQRHTSAGMIFDVAAVLEYVTSFTRLLPGDVIAMGTPSGIGSARKPPIYLRPGDVVVTAVGGIGELRNVCVADGDAGNGRDQ